MSSTNLKELPVVLPPVQEQKAILDFLDIETARIEHLEAKIKAQIEKIKEYRQTLISAAVTGKIDLRQVVEDKAPKSKTANTYFRRIVLAAEVVNRLHQKPQFGRVMLQKVLHLCEDYLGIEELEGNYKREAAGPHDSQQMYSIENSLKKQGWFEAKRTGQRTVYKPGPQFGNHCQYFERYFSDIQTEFDRLIDFFNNPQMDTERAEIISTLFASWNDFLLKGVSPSDTQIVDDVINNWHDSKQRIPKSRWETALSWMREKNIVPRGLGKETVKVLQNSGA